MENLFSVAMLESWKLYGDMRQGMICPAFMNYRQEATTPRGSSDEYFSLWDYICDYPLDGWGLNAKTLALELLEQDKELLYIGAGSGRFCRFLARNDITATNIDLADESIELMGLRNIPATNMDGAAMSYGDNSFPLVVLHSDGVLDAVADPTALIEEASRVGQSVIVGGYEISKTETDVAHVKYTWNGDVLERDYYAHTSTSVEAILVAAGMTLVQKKVWGDDEDPGNESIWGTSYLIEARW